MCWATLKLEEEYPEVVYISTEEFSGLNTEEVIMEVDEPIMEIDKPIIETYDIPLDVEIQEYTIALAEEYKVPHELVFALMEVESDFRTNLISGTNDVGIMQINRINHKWLREELGITDFMDARQNILCGIHMVSELYHKYDGDLHKTLMAYNMGNTGARRLWDKGIYSSRYSREVVNQYEEYYGGMETD